MISIINRKTGGRPARGSRVASGQGVQVLLQYIYIYMGTYTFMGPKVMIW